MMKIPGVTSPCSRRHAASIGRLVAVAVSIAMADSATIEPTIIRLRSTRSAKTASSSAEPATPSVEALMVSPTRASDA